MQKNHKEPNEVVLTRLNMERKVSLSFFFNSEGLPNPIVHFWPNWPIIRILLDIDFFLELEEEQTIRK